MEIADRMQGLKGSAGFALLKRAKELKAQGKDIISLAIGEPCWGTYKALCEAGKKAIDQGWTKYSPSAGREPLRQKLAQHYSKRWGMDISPENVFIGHGCKAVLFGAFQCLCGPKDEVVLPAPYWMSYPPLVRLSGAQLKIVPTSAKNHFKITAQDLEDNLSKNTKVFLLNSPNNPTGSLYSAKELSALAVVLRRYPKVVTMLDGIYSRLVFLEEAHEAPHLLSLCPDLKSRILAFDGASKSHMMTGWRLGWMIGPKAFVQTLSVFQSQSAGCASSIAQKAFEDAFLLCEGDLKAVVQELKTFRDILTEGLKTVPKLKVYPSEGAFYLWLGVGHFIGKKYKDHTIKSSQDIMELLMNEKQLICISGEEFGLPGHLRLSYAVKEKDIKKALPRLQEFFQSIR